MLSIHFFTFNAFEENTYIITNDKKQCWIIDPGMYGERETAKLIAFINENHLLPQAIINTHAHIDHIFGIPALQEIFPIPFGLHELEIPVLKIGTAAAAMYGFQYPYVPKPDFFIKEGQLLKLGDDTLEIFLTPGHSPGSISFYYGKGNWVISGDALFSGSIGRTDLPGGDYNTLITSIRTQLLTLPGDTAVYSGHGPATTIAAEKKYNPYLR